MRVCIFTLITFAFFTLVQSLAEGVGDFSVIHATRPALAAELNREIVLHLLVKAFIDRDARVVDQYVVSNYTQHNPSIPNGAAAIKELIAKLPKNFSYQPGMSVAEGDIVMVHGRVTGLGPKPMVVVDIFRLDEGKIVEHWDVLQEEVSASVSASGNSMFSLDEK